jgi:hypothetical protein
VPDGKRDRNARRLFSSPSLILARFLSYFLFNRNEKELVAVFVFDTLFSFPLG